DGIRAFHVTGVQTCALPILLIYGFNHSSLNEEISIVSPGGCMTNCSVHVLYILNSIGIQSAQINMLHSYTSRQELVDAPHAQFRDRKSVVQGKGVGPGARRR